MSGKKRGRLVTLVLIDLANAFFTTPIPEDKMEQFAFTWEVRQYTFTRLPQGCLHSPTIHLDQFATGPDVMISHYIDDIIIQASSKEYVQRHLVAFVSHMKSKGWEINPAKIQGPS